MFQFIALLAALTAPALPSPALHYDVLISAGHEGRPESCPRFPKHHCNLGAPGERAWTSVVADAAAGILRAHGYSVAREPADFAETYDVKAAIFIHFDGIDKPCTSGASIGYHHANDAAAAAAWRALYAPLFPFKFMPDNFTVNLRDYYGFRQVHADDGALVLELGEVTCPAQKAWLAPRLQWEGATIAHFVSQLLGRGDIPMPG
ncbi:MAG: hypothetical protein M3R35_05620 [Candidatus Eremiobacteraeota bacterium]|nr:hypothetical protein [Candidatus Eremiobacteraeota bacterium]